MIEYFGFYTCRLHRIFLFIITLDWVSYRKIIQKDHQIWQGISNYFTLIRASGINFCLEHRICSFWLQDTLLLALEFRILALVFIPFWYCSLCCTIFIQDSDVIMPFWGMTTSLKVAWGIWCSNGTVQEGEKGDVFITSLKQLHFVRFRLLLGKNCAGSQVTVEHSLDFSEQSTILQVHLLVHQNFCGILIQSIFRGLCDIFCRTGSSVQPRLQLNPL